MHDDDDDRAIQRLRAAFARRPGDRTRVRLVEALERQMTRHHAQGDRDDRVANARERIALLRSVARHVPARRTIDPRHLIDALADLAEALGEVSEHLNDVDDNRHQLQHVINHGWDDRSYEIYQRIQQSFSIYQECLHEMTFSDFDEAILSSDPEDYSIYMQQDMYIRVYMRSRANHVIWRLFDQGIILMAWNVAEHAIALLRRSTAAISAVRSRQSPVMHLIRSIVCTSEYYLARLNHLRRTTLLYAHRATAGIDQLRLPAVADDQTIWPLTDAAQASASIDAALERMQALQEDYDRFDDEWVQLLELRIRLLRVRGAVALYRVPSLEGNDMAASAADATASLSEALELARQLVARRGTGEDAWLLTRLLIDASLDEAWRNDHEAANDYLEEIVALYRRRAAATPTPAAYRGLARALDLVRRQRIKRMVFGHIRAESADASDLDDADEAPAEPGDDDDPATEILHDHRLEEQQQRRRNRLQDAGDRRGLQDSLDESINLLRMAVAERGAPDDYDALVARLLEQATPLLAGRNREAAHEAHAERIAIRRRQAADGDARARQALGIALAEAAWHQQRWGSAGDVPAPLAESLATLRQLTRERGTPGDHYALGIALAHARSIARECGDHGQARQHDDERLAALCLVVRLRGRPIDRRALLDAVAAALTAAQDDHSRIVAVLDAALAALRQCADADAAIDVLNLLRMTAQALQPHDAAGALQAAHQALAWCQQHDLAHHTHGSRYELGRAWFQLADVQRGMQRFGDALHGYRQSIIAWRSLSTGRLLVSFPMIIALALRHCGTCAAAIDDDATALACFGECRQMLESYTDQSLPDVAMLAELWHEVCRFHLTRRQLGQARAAGQASLRLWRSVCALRQIAADRRALAQVRQTLRDIRRLQAAAADA
jgi:hypothetical protein